MKAVRVHEFGSPQVMKVEDLPDLAPGPKQLVIEMKAAGINPVETYIRSGTYANKPDLPYTPGTDGAGVVAVLGREITGFKQGDRVFLSGSLSGTYAAQALCLKEHLHHLPDGLTYAQGAALGVPYATAWRALFQKARAEKGELILVHGGSGGVGMAAIQLAVAAGMKVFASAGTEEGLALVKEQGATAINHRKSGYMEGLFILTEGRGPDVILEMLANVNLEKDLEIVAQQGRIVVIGNRGLSEINPRQFMARECTVTGMMLFHTKPEEYEEIYGGLVESLKAGVIRPVIGREFPLAEVPAAHEAVMSGGAHGKIVVIP